MGSKLLLFVFILLALIFLGLLLKNKNVKSSFLKTLIYAVLLAVIIGAGGFLGLKSLIDISYNLTYILLGIWMLVLGVTNVFILKNIMAWCDQKSFGTELMFTFFTAILGGIVLQLVFVLTDFKFFAGVYLITLFLFVLPYVFYGSVLRYMAIPVKILRKWYYPVDKHIEDPSDREMEMPLVVGFEFKKKHDDVGMTSFRAKAPKEMIFGKLFYYFINDYNHRNPDEKIEFLNEKEKPWGWIFYIKPSWFSKIRYIDPEETNSFNLIKENSVIVCKRLIEK
ncbi:TssN family type VI secretion system protein [Draconibacterium sp. IB214405]|uniref:TssN family type VI secretion system protein n=1 Tax=Draconibacterium sp. IB214405 TaxID=3097352 RepID=UPI002A12B34B|nr:TssN family type VI secretion system protein [Draconibacterium sp. IB214405]MDX8340120.1 TssN family type VI secretion system protein [Draconibacterium sp. IB214405]